MFDSDSEGPFRRGGPWGANAARRGGPHGHGHGGFPFFGGGGFGPFAFFRRGMRARRGDVRAAILALLAEEARNGYQIMQELEQRTNGAWRPSPGSIYPTLEQLEDEGLVRVEQAPSGKTYVLTAAGKKYVEAHPDEHAEPWNMGDDGEDRGELIATFRQLAIAMRQIAMTGNPALTKKAKKILGAAKKELYQLLAEDDEE